MMDWIFDAALHIFLEQILGFVARDDVIPLSESRKEEEEEGSDK